MLTKYFIKADLTVKKKDIQYEQCMGIKKVKTSRDKRRTIK